MVTGATGAIGSARAAQRAAEGHDLVVADDDADLLDALAARLAGTGAVVVPVSVDLASRDGAEELHRRLVGLDRPVALLDVNVEVGRSAGPPIESNGAHVLDLDVRGALHLLGLCVPRLVAAGRGHVLVTSIAGTAAGAGTSAAHLAACVEELRADLEGTGVAVAFEAAATAPGGPPARGPSGSAGSRPPRAGWRAAPSPP